MHQRVQIGVFAAGGAWLLASDDRQARFATCDEAVEAARRLARVELWRGRDPELVVQDAAGRLVGGRHAAPYS